MSKHICVITVLILALLFSTKLLADQSIDKPIVIMIDKGRSGFVITVDSKPPTESLLLTLSQLRRAKNYPKREAVLIVHEAVSLSMLTNAINIMSKAGYVQPRILFFDRHKDSMTEIVISGGMPFSKNPSGTRGEGAKWGPGIHPPF